MVRLLVVFLLLAAHATARPGLGSVDRVLVTFARHGVTLTETEILPINADMLTERDRNHALTVRAARDLLATGNPPWPTRRVTRLVGELNHAHARANAAFRADYVGARLAAYADPTRNIGFFTLEYDGEVHLAYAYVAVINYAQSGDDDGVQRAFAAIQAAAEELTGAPFATSLSEMFEIQYQDLGRFWRAPDRFALPGLSTLPGAATFHVNARLGVTIIINGRTDCPVLRGTDRFDHHLCPLPD